MKKILLIILSVFMMFTVGCNNNSVSKNDFTSQNDSVPKGALELKVDSWVTCRNNRASYTDIQNNFIEAHEDCTDLAIVSNDESIVCIENNNVCIGEKIGEVTLEISTKDKVATLTVKVVTYLEYTKWKIENGRSDPYDKEAYIAACWLIKNINSFKSPKSVEVLNYWIHRTDGEIDYFIMETRAQNSFGGNTMDYTLVEYGKISKGFSPYLYYGILLDGFTQGWSLYTIEQVLKEYKEGVELGGNNI